MKAKHTLGTWEETYCPKEGWGVCVADGGDVLADCIANKSDALLMAAAPELLDALADLLDQLEAVGIYIPDQDSGQWHGTEGLSFTQAEAAIKKAKGE